MFSSSDFCLVSRECLTKLREKSILWENRKDDMINAGFNIFLQFPDMLSWRPDFDFNELRIGYFVICADLAEGSGQDFTPFNIFQIIEKDKYKHIGRWYSNKVDLETAALDFWLLVGQLFNNDRCIWSLEWNTYGALFYNILSNLNEPDYDEKSLYRFNIIKEGLDMSNFAMYKKVSIDNEIPRKKQKSSSNFIPGIKFTAGNKGMSCSLLKMKFEKNQIDTNDMLAIGELENFEDKNGNGSYKASYGHDDIIMTFVQLPMLEKTAKYKEIIEEFESGKISNNMNNKWIDNNIYDMSPGVYDIFL